MSVLLNRWAGLVAATLLATCLFVGRSPANAATTAPESADLGNPTDSARLVVIGSSAARQTSPPQNASNNPPAITGDSADPQALSTPAPLPTPVPEPATLSFLALGSGVLLWSAIRKRNARRKQQVV